MYVDSHQSIKKEQLYDSGSSFVILLKHGLCELVSFVKNWIPFISAVSYILNGPNHSGLPHGTNFT
jgi:hypothetical protein